MSNVLGGLEDALARRDFNASRERFYDDLAEAIEDKESLREFLVSLRDFCMHNKNVPRARLYGRMLERMDEQDGRLSHVLATIVSDDDLMTLRSIDAIRKEKERADNLRFLAANIRKARAMKKTVMKAIASPLMAGPVVIAFMLIVCLYFVPEYEKIASPEKWPWIGRFMYSLSEILRDFGWIILIGLIGAGVAFQRSFARWTGPRRKIADRYLPYRLYRDFHGANFLVALASLINAKSTLAESLEILEAEASPWMAWHIRQILDNMDVYPDDYAEAFKTGILSDDIHMRLSTYARRTGFQGGLVRLGTEGMQHVHDTIERSSSKLNIAAIFGTVGAIMFFYVGNLMISNAITKIMKQDAERVVLIVPAQPMGMKDAQILLAA